MELRFTSRLRSKPHWESWWMHIAKDKESLKTPFVSYMMVSVFNQSVPPRMYVIDYYLILIHWFHSFTHKYFKFYCFFSLKINILIYLLARHGGQRYYWYDSYIYILQMHLICILTMKQMLCCSKLEDIKQPDCTISIYLALCTNYGLEWIGPWNNKEDQHLVPIFTAPTIFSRCRVMLY